MDVKALQQGPLFYAVIDNMYSPEELKSAQSEIDFLFRFKKAASETMTARRDDGTLLKTGSGIFIDDFYATRDNSILLTLNRRIFSNEVVQELKKQNCSYHHMHRVNYDLTLINYYGHEEKYDAHTDKSVFTALTFFKIGDFSGGELCFTENDISINPVPGRVVIFPGCVFHQAKPITADADSYRVTMAQFLNYK